MQDVKDFFSRSAKAPSWSGPPRCRGFTITLRHTTVSRTPLDELSARRIHLYLTTLTTDIHDPDGIRTSNPSRQAATDPHLIPRGQSGRLVCVDRHNKFLSEINILIAKNLLYTYICVDFPHDGIKLPANYNQGRVLQVFVQTPRWRR